MASILQYRGLIDVDALNVGDCTMHRAGDGAGRSWWLLWFRVIPDAGGEALCAAVPVNPRGTYDADGPGGKTWALQPATREGAWNVVPSINVLTSGTVHDGEHPTETSIWHHNVVIEGVPDLEPWARGATP